MGKVRGSSPLGSTGVFCKEVAFFCFFMKKLFKVILFFIILIVVFVLCLPKLVALRLSINKITIEKLIKSGCTHYYKGCNGCVVDTNGGSMCTMAGCTVCVGRICSSYLADLFSRPECIEYNKPVTPLQ
jgi:hypothetical protein